MPASLAESFQVHRTPQEIFNSGSQFELKIFASFVQRDSIDLSVTNIQHEVSEGGCAGKTLQDCSPTYDKYIRNKNLSYYLINPTGRALISMFLFKGTGLQTKMATTLAQVESTVKSI